MSDVSKAREDFLRETINHTMKVRRDEGLYRHIEFSDGGSSVYRFDLITWPGYLTICGDMGTWTFSRTADMFEFFGGNFEKGVNPRYWGEKLQMGSSGRRDEICMEFDEESFKSGLREWLAAWQQDCEEDGEDCSGIISTVNEICEENYSHESQAYQAIHDSDLPSQYELMEGLTMKRYSHHYLWILHAIVWGIGQYTAAKQPANS